MLSVWGQNGKGCIASPRQCQWAGLHNTLSKEWKLSAPVLKVLVKFTITHEPALPLSAFYEINI